MTDAPSRRSARFDVLLIGSDDPSVVSTCSLVRDDGGMLIAVVGAGESRLGRSNRRDRDEGALVLDGA